MAGAAHERPFALDWQKLLRFDGSGWEAIAGPAGVRENDGWGTLGQPFGIGADGTVWVGTTVDRETGLDGLARLDSSGWTTFGPESGVGSWGAKGPWGYAIDRLQVAPDGAVWVDLADPLGDLIEDRFGLQRPAIARFDGSTWTTCVDGVRVTDLAVAADGSVWVTSWRRPGPASTRAGSTWSSLARPRASTSSWHADDISRPTVGVGRRSRPGLAALEPGPVAGAAADRPDGPVV